MLRRITGVRKKNVEMGDNTKKINSIQALRAIAVILVIYAHSIDSANENFGKSYQTQFFYLEDWGAIGLDLFFIISGFIIATVLPAYATKNGWKDFFVKRLTRIVPLYWLLSIVAVFTIAKPVATIKVVVLKSLLFLPLFDAGEFAFPLISVGWSLSYEVYFYALAGLLLISTIKKLYTTIIATLFILSIAGYLIDPANIFLKFIGSPLLLEFGIGVIVAIVYEHAPKVFTESSLKVGAIALPILGATLMIATIFTGYKNLSEAGIVINFNRPALYRSVIWGIPCGMLVCGLILVEKMKLVTIPTVLVHVGNASYSAYLMQGFVIYYFSRIYKLTVNSQPDLYIVLCTAVCTAASIPVHAYIEKTLIRRTNKLLRRR